MRGRGGLGKEQLIVDQGGFRLDRNACIIANQDIGSVTIRGDFVGRTGLNGTTSPFISAQGQATPGATTDVAIKSVSIGGRFAFANILAGYDIGPSAANADAQIGKVTVGGDWIASNVVAGVQDNANTTLDAFFGDADDQVVAGGNPAIFSRIGAVIVKGQVSGTQGFTDRFAVTAQQIGSFKVGPAKLPLTSATDAPFTLGFPAGDLVVKEI